MEHFIQHLSDVLNRAYIEYQAIIASLTQVMPNAYFFVLETLLSIPVSLTGLKRCHGCDRLIDVVTNKRTCIYCARHLACETGKNIYFLGYAMEKLKEDNRLVYVMLLDDIYSGLIYLYEDNVSKITSAVSVNRMAGECQACSNALCGACQKVDYPFRQEMGATAEELEMPVPKHPAIVVHETWRRDCHPANPQ